jgi:hypothetical protein
MTPTPLPNEGLRAFAAFKMYAEDGPKRSIRRCARRLHKSPTIIARWSKKYSWQNRLRELELEDCKRAVTADEVVKLSLEKERERERLKFQKRAIEVSRKATERAMEILKQPLKGTRPSDAARLLAVADVIGRRVLGLPSANVEEGTPDSSPFILQIVNREEPTDEFSKQVRQNELEYLREHPEHPQAKPGSWWRRFADAQHGEGWSERQLNCSSDEVRPSPETD